MISLNNLYRIKLKQAQLCKHSIKYSEAETSKLQTIDLPVFLTKVLIYLKFFLCGM